MIVYSTLFEVSPLILTIKWSCSLTVTAEAAQTKIETNFTPAGYLEFCLDQRLYEALDVRLIYTLDSNCGNMRYIGDCIPAFCTTAVYR